jgi:hypothetical protein
MADRGVLVGGHDGIGSDLDPNQVCEGSPQEGRRPGSSSRALNVPGLVTRLYPQGQRQACDEAQGSGRFVHHRNRAANAFDLIPEAGQSELN